MFALHYLYSPFIVFYFAFIIFYIMKYFIKLSILLVFTSLMMNCTNSSNNSNKENTNIPQQLLYGADVSDAFDIDRLQRIDSAYQRMIDYGYMPQCVTMVIHNGRVVHNKAFGWRDIENKIPCETTDIFRIASQTKAITIVGLMTLFEEGRFQLDEPIKKYIPEFANPVVLDKYDKRTNKWTTHPANKDITIRHLITHTSGLCTDGIFDAICKSLGIAAHNSLDSITLEENVRRMASLPLKHEPGAEFTYAFNTDVLGRLCEILSGQDIYSFLKERVLDPLDMHDTYFHVPADKADRIVTLYEYSVGGSLCKSQNELYQTFPYAGAGMLCSPSAGLCGTIEDYAKFCQMILNNGEFNGHRILGRKTLEMMQKNGVGDMRGEIGFGMAWDVFTPANAHNTILSEGSMRWGGMFGTDYVIDPKENLILLMYVNNMPNMSGENPKTLLHNTVYQALK